MMIQRAEAATWRWERETARDEAAFRAVQDMVAEVRRDGDAAVRRLTERFDGISGAAEAGFALRVTEAVLRAAWDAMDSQLQAALQRAAQRIRRFHELQVRSDITLTGADGEVLGITWRPLRRVGVYAPGGRAAYPSTVLMNVIPAQVAGVEDIVLVSPPQPDTGWPHPYVCAAAHLLGVREVYRVGGAQAIAALAYGTQEIPRVDKIVGPGSQFVALAKKAVMGDVGIDSIAGPSEVFVVADATANPEYIAADLLAQAEHDPQAGAVCITTDPALADAVEAALSRQLATLPRRETALQALAAWGAIVHARDMDEAIAVVNRFAPEHVELMVAQPRRWLERLHAAGAVFLGAHTPESVGDYYAGTNHVLPTHGTARFASGLGVDDFLRRLSFVEYAPETLAKHAVDICTLAEAEGLTAHARAVEIRGMGDDA